MALTITALAAALGISRAAVAKCHRFGMPIDSIEAARAWRAAHLNPARMKRPPATDDRAALIADIEQLGRLVAAQPGDEGLRLALHWALAELLTAEEFERVLLPPAAWQALVQAPALGQVGRA